MSSSKRGVDEKWCARKGAIRPGSRNNQGGRGWSEPLSPPSDAVSEPTEEDPPVKLTNPHPVSSNSPTPEPEVTTSEVTPDPSPTPKPAELYRPPKSKRGVDEKWGGGRGGIPPGNRNTPGGRGWSARLPPPSDAGSEPTNEDPPVKVTNPYPRSSKPNELSPTPEVTADPSTIPKLIPVDPSRIPYTPPCKKASHSLDPAPLPTPGRLYKPSPSHSGSDSHSWKRTTTSSGSESSVSKSVSPSPTRSDADSWRKLAPSMEVPDPEIKIKWQPQFQKFLEEYRHPGHKFNFYKANVEMLKLLETFDISIDFGHILEWDKDLAYILCQEKERESDTSWIEEAAGVFLKNMGVLSGVGHISFTNMPKSFKIGKEIFINTDGLLAPVTLFFNQQEMAVISSYHFSQIVCSIICTMLSKTSCGFSWRGNLKIEDLMYTEETSGMIQVHFRKEPECSDATREDKVLDIKSIWPMIKEVVTSYGLLPPYFGQLKSDLLNVNVDFVDEPWFHEYMIYHAAFVSSMGRRNFKTGLYLVCANWRLHQDHYYKCIFDQKPFDGDWRETAKTNPNLNINYAHDNDPNVLQKKTGDGISFPKTVDRYDDNTWSFLEFRRHVLTHPRIVMKDLDESEVYLAKLSFLPKLIFELLKKCHMKRQFATIWSAYKSCRLDPRRLS